MGYFDDLQPLKFAPSSKVYQGVPKVTPAPAPAPITNQLPKPTNSVVIPPTSVSAPQPQYQPKQDPTLMERIFQGLNLPSQITENVLTRGQGYEKAVSGVFPRESTQKVVGFAGRVFLDPLNLIPVGKLGKVGNFLEKIPGVEKAMSKVDDVSKVVKTAVSKVSEVPFISKAKDALGERFIQGYKLPEEYNLLKHDIPSKEAMGAEQIVTRTAQQFQNVSKEKDVIEAIPKFLEPKGAGAGVDLGVLRKTIDETHGAGYFEKEVRPILGEVKKQFNADIYDLVDRGRIDGETAKTLLNQGGYYPHMDFATDKMKEYFRAFKIGEKRGYLKRREGFEGFTFNAPKAIAQRELAQFQDNVIQDFLRDVKTKFGTQLGKGKTMPAGYKDFVDTTGRLRELNGWALPERIVKDLNDTFSPAGEIASVIDGFNRVWKPTATSLNPAFHIQNVIGNLYNTWLGGMKDPRRFVQAIKGGFTAEEQAALKNSGILARGQFGADLIERTFNKPEGLKALNAVEPFRHAGEILENNARSAFFLDQRAKFIKQGLSDVDATRKAVQKTNEFLFDYLTGLTPFETNVMRRIFPFYTWSRFNIPLQLRTIVTQPEKVAFVSKVNRFINDGTDFREGDQPGITFPTPFSDTNGNPIRWRPNLPVQDIFGLDSKRVYGMLNPLIKEPYEALRYAGTPDNVPYTDTYTGKEITNKNLPGGIQARDIIKNRATSLIRPLRSSQRIYEDFSPSGILRQIVGGTYTLNPDTVQMIQGNKKNYQNKALQDRMQLILRDKTLTAEEKNAKIQEIQNYMRTLQ